MMGQAIEERRRHFGVAKDTGPFAEAQVCGDYDAGAFIEFAQQVKEQGAAGRAEWQITQRKCSSDQLFSGAWRWCGYR